jgi:quinohemoprotein amine dehydrogenase
MASTFLRTAQFALSFGSRRRLACGFFSCMGFAAIVSGQSSGTLSQTQDRRQQAPATEAAKTVREEGIPVTDPLVRAKCGNCHASDERGNMQRISWERTTPEGWQDVLKRMIVVKGVAVTPSEARSIVKYLSVQK